MKKLTVIYPVGGGGNWLCNLVHHLESRTYQIDAPTDNIFDYTAKSRVIAVKHWYDYDIADMESDLANKELNLKIFSCYSEFNQWLQWAYKIILNPHKTPAYAALSFNDRFFYLTDCAVFLLGSTYKKLFRSNIDLRYDWIFTAPNDFCNQLTDILGESAEQIDMNKEFALLSIDNYKKTCVHPGDVFNNPKNIIWLSWCHALAHIDPLEIESDFRNANTVDDLAEMLYPHNEYFKEQTLNKMFIWNNENTTR